MISVKMAGMLLAAFVAGSFVASPELRAYAANTVTSIDIKDGEVKTPDLANNAVTSAKIKDGEIKTDDIAPNAIGSLRIKDNDVKAQDIAPDAVEASEIAANAVGASEIAGVDKLIFADCDVPKIGTVFAPNQRTLVNCQIAGMDSEDDVIVMDNTPDCFELEGATINNVVLGSVTLVLENICPDHRSIPKQHFAIIVYDELPDKTVP